MRILIIVFLASLVLHFSACTGEKKLNIDQQIENQEAVMFTSSGQFNTDIAEKLVSLYMIRVDSMEKDSLRPDYLFKAADVSINLDNHSRTLLLLNRMINEYPRHEKAAMSQFLKGFVYENQLNDTALAHKAYEEYLHRFPDGEFIQEAVLAIQNLGKSPEEFIRQFEIQNQ